MTENWWQITSVLSLTYIAATVTSSLTYYIIYPTTTVTSYTDVVEYNVTKTTMPLSIGRNPITLLTNGAPKLPEVTKVLTGQATTTDGTVL